MLRKDPILCKTRNLLNEFMAPITAKTDKLRQKFLRQAVGAILLSGSLIVTEFAYWIHDDCSDVFHTLKRLLNHLTSPRGDLTAAVQAYRQTAAKYIQPDTPIPIDLTDLVKPRARKMKYLNLVHDGNDKRGKVYIFNGNRRVDKAVIILILSQNNVSQSTVVWQVIKIPTMLNGYLLILPCVTLSENEQKIKRKLLSARWDVLKLRFSHNPKT